MLSPSRRSFLRTASLAAAGLPLTGSFLAAAPARLPGRPAFGPVRVRGIVRAGGRGVPGVAISDGRSVAATAADGTFELFSDRTRPFVFLSLPSGYAVPVSPRGSARLFAPIAPSSSGEATAEFDLTRSELSEDRHHFLLLADPQTLDADDMALLHRTTVPDVRETVAGLPGQSVFGVGCGDLMFDRLEFFPEYERAVQQTGLPFFQVLGNHDVDILAQSDETSAATFLRTFGPTNYSFNRGAVHYVVLDDVLWVGEGYIGYLHQEQLDWLRADLALVEPGRPVVLFAHIPVYSTQHLRNGQKRPERHAVVANRAALYDILEPYPTHIIAGHMHEIEHAREGPVETHVVGAVCGAWWSGPICGDGTPNGYGLFTVQGESLSWQYKGTGHPLGHQMRLSPPGSDPAHPADFVANIWDWDPAWEILWFEDGRPRGALRQQRGQDPLARQLHTGPDLPAKHPWVEPYTTDHLFHATPAHGTRQVTVQATDRFGRRHSQTLDLHPA